MKLFSHNSFVRRLYCALLGASIAVGVSAPRAFSQFAPPPGAANDTQTGSTGASTTSSNPLSGSAFPLGSNASDASETDAMSPFGANEANAQGFSGGNTVLSAGQIMMILQQRPELVVELKSYVADNLQQQGTPVQPESISDEALYSQIATNRQVRAGITDFLRARGYVSDEDLQRAAVTRPDATGQSGLGDAQSSGSLLGGQLQSLQGGQEDAGAAPPLNSLNPLETDSNVEISAPTQNEPSRPRDRALGQPRNTTDEPQVVHQAPPYNLQSLRDLYSQLPSAPEHLRRFGSDVFVSRDAKAGGALSATATAPALDVPIGPDYVVGPGDMLNVSLWGGLSQTLPRTVDREGRVMLPEAGEVQVAGLTLGRAESVITSALQRQFRNAQVAVTVARLRTVRVYVVGDVQRPGAYDISSLSSPLSALYAAGGPTATGSLRVLKHLRSDKLIGEIDLYDFLLHGIRTDDDKLEGGDTLLVPPAGPQVAVYGAVKRPAIYELHNETSLAAVMEEAGGATVAASLGHITVERIDANQQRETIGLNMAGSGAAGAAQAAIASFEVKDGDRVRVVSIAPYSERVVYVRGHVVRPGREPYRDGMRLSDVLHSYQDLLPEPAERGEIVRLVPPDLHPEAIEFDVPDVLIGNSNLPLQPFDTIRVYGRYEHDAPNVQIRGEVIRPGSYALSEGMTAADLVRMAGGFKRDALLDDADLISYSVVNGTKAIQERRDLRIGDAVQKSDRDADAPLKAGDVLTIHQITGWSDIGASIRIEGEVGHPGSYGFRQGEHLSDVLLRAGGFRDTAYAEGAVLTRPEVRALEEKSRDELVRQIETSSAAARLSPAVSGTGDQGGTLQLIQQQQQQVLSRLKNQPATGRMVIHINADIKSWAGTTADIEVRAGDVLRVPKRPGFVLVSGQVYNAVAITFAPGKSAKWYLQRAGGATQVANRGQIFIIRANGSVVGRTPGWYGHDVLSTRLEPGDVIVVPQKIIGASLWWRNLLGTAQIASSIAIAAAVGAGL